MKPTKTQSMKSLRSTKSMSNCASQDKGPDFDELVTSACRKFELSRRAVVKKDFQIDDYLKSMKQSQGTPVKYKKLSLAPELHRNLAQETPSEKDTKTEESDVKSIISVVDDDTVVITAVYDNMNHLVEILFHKQRHVPRVLLKILGLILPNYRNLTKITMKRSKVDVYTIYEMSKFLSLTYITEICLDDSPLSGFAPNYVILLEAPCRLTSLSLCRCNINDETCDEIASKLHYLQSAEATLSTLNLSSNRITDIGAKSIGKALRTNRHLRYLNLADNRIGDDGVDHIFHALMDFALSYDEILEKRRRYMQYMKAKQALVLKYTTEYDSKSFDDASVFSKKSSRKAPAKSKKEKISKAGVDNDDFITARAEMIARELIGPFIDPFTSYSTKIVDGYSHCLGNMVLCYLNVSYNNLTHFSIKRLLSVLVYQNINKKLGQTGLLKVLIDGNPVPSSAVELGSISDLLQKNVISFTPRFIMDRRKSKGRISMVPDKIRAT